MDAPKAGNTTKTLKAIDVFEAAEDKAAQTTIVTNPTQEDLDAFVGDKQNGSIVEIQEDYVLRSEFDVLIARIDKYNRQAPHKI